MYFYGLSMWFYFIFSISVLNQWLPQGTVKFNIAFQHTGKCSESYP
jgi:hypothetical protein